MTAGNTPPDEMSRDDGRAFLVEWQGKQIDALAVVKRGKVFFRTADNRTLGRATVIARLLRPGEQVTAAAADGGGLGEIVTPAPHADLTSTPESGHWADSIPVASAPPTPGSPTPHVAPPAAPDTPEPAPADDQPPAPAVHFDGGRWVSADADGAVVTVWPHGDVRVPDVDRELTAARLRVAQLEVLRRTVATDRENTIAEHVARLASADGVDVAAASPAQIAQWRRYAEAIVGQ